MAQYEYRVGSHQWNNATRVQQKTLVELFAPAEFDWAGILTDRVACAGDAEGLREFIEEVVGAFVLPEEGMGCFRDLLSSAFPED